MKKGEKLFKFLASLILREFYGTVTIRFEAGKVTHVATETRRTWRYCDLADDVVQGPCGIACGCQSQERVSPRE